PGICRRTLHLIWHQHLRPMPRPVRVPVSLVEMNPTPPAGDGMGLGIPGWETHMSTITAKDGAKIFYKDWGAGQPVVFSHGWPLNADAWDEQLHLFASTGFRAIAHDRRGHGRSTQTWTGN